MPWKGVTVSEHRQRFLEDYHLSYYSITQLAERVSISRQTATTPPAHQGQWPTSIQSTRQGGCHT